MHDVSLPPALCLVGVPGVGKSFLARTVAEQHPRLARHCVGSSIVREVIAPEPLARMDFLSDEARVAARAEAVRRLECIRRDASTALLVDGHLVLRNRRTRALERVFGEPDASFFTALVWIDADPEFVESLRAGDDRPRPTESRAELEEHLASEREAATSFVATTGKPLLRIVDRSPDVRARQLLGFLADLSLRGADR